MAEVKSVWWVRVTTGDAQGLLRALRKINPDLRDRVEIQPIHDDDPDSDRIVSIGVGTLAELREALDAVDKSHHIVGLVVAASVQSGGAIAWTHIGQDWLEHHDTVKGDLNIRESERQSEAHRAIKEAVQILTSVE